MRKHRKRGESKNKKNISKCEKKYKTGQCIFTTKTFQRKV